ncbi:MAG: hypothetical protein DMD59_05480 [Gemmatimonadetes bacterium]|nr:MAG: hypothetical protein DMD59_05480 [Gemmatimonadota bacterium]
MIGRLRNTDLAAVALTLLLAWLVVYPILVVGADAADGTAVRAFVTRPGEWAALWASVWISLVSVILAAAIGIPLAFLFEWFDFPGRKTLGALIALPVLLSPLVGVIAFLFLYGESGFIARVWRVIVPLLRPSLVGAAMLTFMTALGSFSAPYIFGGGFRVMTTQIVATKLNGDLPLAMVETVALALVAVLGLVMLRRTEGDDILVALGKGIAPRPRPIRRASVRRLTTALGWGFAVLLLLPHLTLLLVSLVPYGAWTTEILPPVINFENYRRLFSEAERLRPMVNSLWMAAVSTAIAVALALGAGWLVVRRRVAWRRVIEGLLALPWALPGTVFAIALAITFSVHAPLQLRFVLVGTAVILPLAYLVRALPLTGRGILASYRQLDPSLEEAAASLGAGRWRTLARVTLPQLRPGLAAGASLAFVAALGDIVASIVLYTYETRPVSIEILSSLRLSETGVAAAFGVVLMLVSAIVLGVGARR